jgi:Effector-associated domain 1
MGLDPPQIESLHAAVVNAFNAGELAQLARFKLGKPLEMLVSIKAGTKQVAFDLIECVERQGWTEEFIRGVYDLRPDNPLVRAFCEANARYVFEPRPTTRDLAQAIGAGLTALAGRLDETRGAIRAILAGEARGHLADLGTQFTRLRRYKVLHGCLHNLQFKYARLIASELRILPENPDEAENLRILLAEMADELALCRPESAGLPSATAETLWLNVACESVRRLRQGVDARDPAVSTAGLQMLEGLLRVQPTRINELLTSVLESLRFDHLVAAFDRIHKEAAHDHTSGTALAKATTALGNLAPRLNRVLSDHKDWQLVDNTLQQIDTDLKLGGDPAVSAFLWQEADRVLQSLLNQERGVSWSEELRTLAAVLTGAFMGAASDAVKKAFRPLKARASWFFYLADKGLNDLALDLDSVGVKLGQILEGIGDEHA